MTDSESVRDEGYDEFLDALAAEDMDGYYLECPNGHGSLPPRRACPHCGETALEETPLPDDGRVVTYTVVHVPTPQFEADAPYVTAIADFGSVRLTGIVRGIDPDTVETGLTVWPTVEETETTGRRLLVFRPTGAD